VQFLVGNPEVKRQLRPQYDERIALKFSLKIKNVRILFV
jgi:hypothetical protein